MRASGGNFIRDMFFFLVLLSIAPSLIKNIKEQYSDFFESKTKVGLIKIESTILDASSYIKNLKKLFEKEEIKAILLQIDSPGGAAGSSQALFSELKALKKKYKKYVVALVENIAASGGYYVACAADDIVASPAAFIGSIGAYIAHPTVKDLLEHYNIKYDIVKAGEYKTVASPFVDLSDKGRKLLQNLTNDVYDQFVGDVAVSRPGVPENPVLWADGKIFSGKQALQLGLIDRLGSISDARDLLEEKAGIIGKIEWVTPTTSRGLLTSLLYGEETRDGSISTYIWQQVHNWLKPGTYFHALSIDTP